MILVKEKIVRGLDDNMEIVILAGGKGTRMGEQTEKVPKPMICVGDKPMLLHLVDYYMYWGATRFVICCGYKYEYIQQYFSCVSRDVWTVDKNTVGVTYKNTEVLLVNTGMDTGTAGRIKKIRNYLREKCFHLTYGDGLSSINISELIKEHFNSNRSVTITAVHPRERFGLMILDDNKVIKFQEKNKRSDVWINGGFMIINTNVFDYIRETDVSFEYDVLPRIVEKELVGAYKHSGFWQCMDTEDEKKELDKIWATGNAPWLL